MEEKHGIGIELREIKKDENQESEEEESAISRQIWRDLGEEN